MFVAAHVIVKWAGTGHAVLKWAGTGNAVLCDGSRCSDKRVLITKAFYCIVKLDCALHIILGTVQFHFHKVSITLHITCKVSCLIHNTLRFFFVKM